MSLQYASTCSPPSAADWNTARDWIVPEAQRLYAHALQLLCRAEGQGDLKTSMAALREARTLLSLLTRLALEQERRARAASPARSRGRAVPDTAPVPPAAGEPAPPPAETATPAGSNGSDGRQLEPVSPAVPVTSAPIAGAPLSPSSEIHAATWTQECAGESLRDNGWPADPGELPALQLGAGPTLPSSGPSDAPGAMPAVDSAHLAATTRISDTVQPPRREGNPPPIECPPEEPPVRIPPGPPLGDRSI